MPKHGDPNPTLRLGQLVIDEQLRPCYLVDDDVQSPIRKVKIDGLETEVWASDLEAVSPEEYEQALALRALDRLADQRRRADGGEGAGSRAVSA